MKPLKDRELAREIDECMAIVMHNVRELGIIPLVLIGVNDEEQTRALMPCGPGPTPEMILKVLEEMVEGLKKNGYQYIDRRKETT